jgi:hypothetical protein
MIPWEKDSQKILSRHIAIIQSREAFPHFELNRIFSQHLPALFSIYASVPLDQGTSIPDPYGQIAKVLNVSHSTTTEAKAAHVQGLI